MSFPNNNNVEIQDVENFSNPAEEGFSHQQQVSKIINKVIDLGSKEMKPGFIQTKTDVNGNVTRTIIEDSRKAFIEGVKTCLTIMICDLDEEAIDNIYKIEEEIEKKRNDLLKLEQDEWDMFNKSQKRILAEKGLGTKKNLFNIEKQYYQKNIEYEVDYYRKIFMELILMTKRLGFYKAEVIDA
jgi:hypothetical protein